MLREVPDQPLAVVEAQSSQQPAGGPWLPWLAGGLALGCAWPDSGHPPRLLVFILLAGAVLLGCWVATRCRPLLLRLLIAGASLLLGMIAGAEHAQGHLPAEQFISTSARVERVLYEGFALGLLVRPQHPDLPNLLAVHAPYVRGLRSDDVIHVKGLLQRDEFPPGRLRPRLRASRIRLVQRREEGLRGFAWQSIDRMPAHRDLAAALLLGAGRPESRDLFHQAGILHLLAVSGLHLGLALLMWAWLLRTLGLPWLPRQILLIAGALAYAWLVGYSLPTQRALVMTVAVVLYGLSGRSPHRLGPLSLAVLVLLIRDPLQARQVGFQLSALAVFGILSLGLDLVDLRRSLLPLRPWPLDRPLWRLLLYLLNGLCDGLAVGVAATLAVMPITALHFSEITPWSPLISVLASPFLLLVLGAGLPLLFLQAGLPQGPWSGLYRLVDLGLQGLIGVAEQSAHWFEHSLVEVAGMPLWMLPLWYLSFLPSWASLPLRLGLLLALLLLWCFFTAT